MSVKYFAISSRAHSLSVSFQRRSRFGHHAFERLGGLVGTRAVVVGELDAVVAGAVEDRVLRLLRQVLPLGVERELVVLAERLQGLDVIGARRLRPRRDGAAAQGLVLVGNDQVGVDVLLDPEPAAGRAGAERIVEGEQPRLDLGDRESRHRAGEFFREDQAFAGIVLRLVGLAAAGRRGAVRELGDGEPLGELERGLQRIRQPGPEVGPHHQPVHHHVDVVLELLVERRRVGDLVELAVDLHALEAALHVVGELLAVLALPCRAPPAPADRAACLPAAP